MKTIGISTYGQNLDAYHKALRKLAAESSLADHHEEHWQLSFPVGRQMRSIKLVRSVLDTWS
jgi:hypothetical protein